MADVTPLASTFSGTKGDTFDRRSAVSLRVGLLSMFKMGPMELMLSTLRTVRHGRMCEKYWRQWWNSGVIFGTSPFSAGQIHLFFRSKLGT